MATAFLISAYYMLLLAWILGYFLMIAGGSMTVGSPDQIQASFDAFRERPLPVLGYDLVIVMMMAVVVARGLRGGVERVAKVAMPVILGMLILLMIRSMTFPGAAAGLVWYLKSTTQVSEDRSLSRRFSAGPEVRFSSRSTP